MAGRARHLLFIFSDQHTQRVAGCYGDPVVETPNIDRIAAEGARFDNCYCPSPICVPSRMAMLTARHPHRQECWTNDDQLRSDLPTWLHMLGGAGLHPVLVGRMHAMGLDQHHGYAERLVGEHSPNWAGKTYPGMGVLSGTNGPSAVSVVRSGPGRSIYQQKDRDVTDAALAWLRTNGAARLAEGRGVCLTVGYMMPHAPYVVDDAAYAHYAGRVPPPRLPLREETEHPFHTWWRGSRGGEITEDPHDVGRARAAYWGLVHRMDEMIGELLAELEAMGILDDTLVVYASDHGDHLGERGLWWKHTFFEESVKVPLVMRLPGVIEPGQARGEVVNLIDLSATMVELLDAGPIPHSDGRSFAGLFAGDSWHDRTFSEYCTDPVPNWTAGRAVRQRMVRDGDWKLVVYDAEPPQLFDLASDPDELADRATDPAAQEVFDRLFALVSDGWDADAIEELMRVRRDQKAAIAAWVREVQPPDTLIWSFAPEDNALRDAPPA